MQPVQPRLAIHYGAANTYAVLAMPDGRWQPLAFDGAPALSSAAHVAAPGDVAVGNPGWARALTQPHGFVPSPLRVGAPTVTASDGNEVETRDLVAAALRRVGDEAAALLGAPVHDVRMVVPAGWGPRRRTWLRHAAHAAGLGQPRLVEAPVAAAERLLAVGVQVPVGAFLLFCDIGAGCEATVLRRGPTGFEVLATAADADAGGAHLDDALVTAVPAPDALEPGSRWQLLAAVRAAKEAVSQQAAVTVALPPPSPPLVLTAALVQDLAAPVLTRAGQLAAQAVHNAELTAEQLFGVYAIGAATTMPAAASAIAEQVGVPVQTVVQPGFTAVLGAAEAGTVADTAPGTAAAPAVPGVGRLLGLAMPGVASLALFTHFLVTADFHNATPEYPRSAYYVLAVWGELTLAAVFAMAGCLQAGALFGAALRHPTGTGPGPGASPVAGGIALAATAGMAIAGLYGVTAAVFFDMAVPALLRWALLPVAPIALCAVAIAWLARTRNPASSTWNDWLAFPISSVVLAATGLVLMAIPWRGPIPAAMAGWAQTAGQVGGLVFGAGIACALTSRGLLRAIAGVPLAFFGLIIGPSAIGILAVIYALAVTVWWGHQLWQLTRVPAPVAQHVA